MKNIYSFQEYKKLNQKISMVTCYDYWSAKIIEKTDIDCILVGDSVAMVVHGFDSTVHATNEMMGLHTAAVRRGTNKFIIADMPFLSFRKSRSFAMECVHSLMTSGANAVKLEGVDGHENTVEHIVKSGIPVMAHIGLTPQSIHQIGGFRVQGKEQKEAEHLFKQAKKLQDLGCFAIVLECVPSTLAEKITQELAIPTIGIGAGNKTSGQVLVLQDLLGMDSSFSPKFLKRFLDGESDIKCALNQFDLEVKQTLFPSVKESYS